MGNEYYAVIERNDTGEPVCTLTGPNPTLDALADAGQMLRWSFRYTRESGRRYNVYVYHDPSPAVARSEDREALNKRVMDIIAQTPEVEQDMLSLWGGRLAIAVIFTALVINNLRNGLIVGGIALAIIFSIAAYMYYRSRPIR